MRRRRNCRKESPGDTQDLSLGSEQVAGILESLCRGRVLAVDMIGLNSIIEIEGDVLASAGGIPHARGVIEVIDEVLRPEIGTEKENKGCTGVAG